MARINCSISDELKARMDSAGEGINWSQVASEAFEAYLDQQGAARGDEVSAEIAGALLQGPGLALEVLGKVLGSAFPLAGRAMTESLAPMVKRLAQSSQRGPGPEAAIDELRATLGAEVILLRLEMLQRSEDRRKRRSQRQLSSRMEERIEARKTRRRKGRKGESGSRDGGVPGGGDGGSEASAP